MRQFRIKAIGRVAMAAGRAQGLARDKQARAGNDARIDAVLQGYDDAGLAPDIANGGEASQQRGFQIIDAVQFVIEPGAGDGVADRVALVETGGDVVVAIDQARRHGVGGQVDQLGARWRFDKARRHLGYAVIVDQDRHLGLGGF